MTSPSPGSAWPPARNLVTRADGKLVNVARKTGQLFVCANGCCCGHTERGFAPINLDLYHNEWVRRRLRNKVHLSLGGCLGPCPLANVVLLLFDGRALWFHSFNTDAQVAALYDYIEQMLAAQAYLPTPPALADYHFTAFNWDVPATAAHEAMVEQNSAGAERAGLVFLTQADTDLLALSKVVPTLGPNFPKVSAFNLSHLKTDEDVAAFLSATLPSAEVIVLRLLGRTTFPGGLERVVEHARQNDQWLICLPGTDALDPDLTAASNVGVPTVHEAFAYLQFGGLKNYQNLLRFLSDHLLMTGFGYERPEPQPRHGVYWLDGQEETLEVWRRRADPLKPTIGVLFYRAHMLSGNTAFVDALIREGEERGANVLPVYAYSLKDFPEGETSTSGEGPVPSALRYFLDAERHPIVDVLVCTMSFASGQVESPAGEDASWSTEALRSLDVPVIQAITAGMRREQWASSSRGLTPLDTGINVAIPEFDGRIVSVPISFKEAVPTGHDDRCAAECGCGRVELGSPVVQYVPEPDRVKRVIGQALRWAALRRKLNKDKRIAFVLTNYNTKVSRIANAVGLDSPASLLHLLEEMRAAGYAIGALPPDSDTLLRMLVERGSYDQDVLTAEQLANPAARISAERYGEWFAALPSKSQAEMGNRWDQPPGRHYVDTKGALALAGLEFGSVFVAIQPPRGYSMDPAAIYHTPDLAPPHPYYALYRWLSTPVEAGGWGADAVVHMGKHGTLEWLPGKGIGLSGECYPDMFLGDLPLIYPFIINDPGEGAQAKRRAHAVIIDHLTPPMTTAEGYGEIEELTRLVDEYYQLEKLDPSKLPLLQQQIWALIKQARLDADLGKVMNRSSNTHTHEWDTEYHEDGVPYTISDLTGRDFAHLVENINGYLCELTSALIRDGLHILGRPPAGAQLVDMLLSLVRVPNLHVPSLRAGVAAWHGLELAPILDDLGKRSDASLAALSKAVGRDLATHADALEGIDEVCRRLIKGLAEAGFDHSSMPAVMRATLLAPALPGAGWEDVERTLRFVCNDLVPNLGRTTAEVTNILHALDGGYIPAGPSGAPTRGMAHVLPTGRNFYTLDPLAMPSLAAWRVGWQLAEALMARHQSDEGDCPETIGISIWGTSAMRTHGDDIAEVLALLGVRPRWQAESRRVVGIEVIPLAELGRPRIDVVCRISGFFRDAFPHLIALLDEAFRTVAALEEPPDQNFVRKHQQAEEGRLMGSGVPRGQAAQRASYRIFGCKPGAYGAGILPLIDERNWRDTADFAEAYINWGGYVYTAQAQGVDARAEFRQALGSVQAAVKNQDNREHDIFDSDDYFQYHGGMIATIRALSGKNPRRYFGDSADPQRPKVRDLKEEALRVFRSRVINPKWLASIQRHGYKGALELAATVDYMFGYDATSGIVDDWMYQRLAETYALDPQLHDFFLRSNPWALKDIAARLLEAAARGLWAEPGELLQALEQVYQDVEDALNGHVYHVEELALRAHGSGRQEP